MPDPEIVDFGELFARIHVAEEKISKRAFLIEEVRIQAAAREELKELLEIWDRAIKNGHKEKYERT